MLECCPRQRRAKVSKESPLAYGTLKLWRDKSPARISLATRLWRQRDGESQAQTQSMFFFFDS